MAAGVRNAASAVISAAQSLASRVRSLIHFSVPDTGPLSDADEYMPDFMELLAKGIKGNSGSVLDKVKAMTGQIREMMQSMGVEDLPEFDFPEFHLPDLKLPKLGDMGMPQMALAGAGSSTTTNNNQRTVNMGGLHITVNGYNAQNDDQLATMVANKINEMMDEDNSVFK